MTRLSGILVTSLMLFSLAACTHRNDERVGEQARKAERQSEKAAHVLGKAAYKAAEEGGRLAHKAGEQIKQASHDAHQGWEEEKQKEKARSDSH